MPETDETESGARFYKHVPETEETELDVRPKQMPETEETCECFDKRMPEMEETGERFNKQAGTGDGGDRVGCAPPADTGNGGDW